MERDTKYLPNHRRSVPRISQKATCGWKGVGKCVGKEKVALWDVETLKSGSTIREKPAPLIPYEVYIVKIVEAETFGK